MRGIEYQLRRPVQGSASSAGGLPLRDKQPVHGVDELRRREWLGDERHRWPRCGAGERQLAGVARHVEHLEPGLAFEQLAGEFDAAQPRHDDVGYEKVNVVEVGERRLQGELAIGSRGHAHPRHLQHALGECAQLCLIFHNQDAGRRQAVFAGEPARLGAALALDRGSNKRNRSP